MAASEAFSWGRIKAAMEPAPTSEQGFLQRLLELLVVTTVKVGLLAMFAFLLLRGSFPFARSDGALEAPQGEGSDGEGTDGEGRL